LGTKGVPSTRPLFRCVYVVELALVYEKRGWNCVSRRENRAIALELSNGRANVTSNRENPPSLLANVMNEFFDNLLRYFRYFISVSLGIFFAFFGWLKPLLKNPITAIALVGMLVGSIAFVFFTLKAMLGLA